MTTSLPLNDLHLRDPNQSGQSLQTQLYQALSQRILDGRLQPGDRLPSSRLLAKDLGVARNTVLAVFDQLQAEGFIRHQPRSGTFVDPRLPDQPPFYPGPARSKRLPAGQLESFAASAGKSYSTARLRQPPGLSAAAPCHRRLLTPSTRRALPPRPDHHHLWRAAGTVDDRRTVSARR